jgi:hypothetical protein
MSKEYLKAPVVITYRSSQRSKKKKVKVLRGNTSTNLEKALTAKIKGMNDKTVIDHIGVGYRYIPDTKRTASDRKRLEQ